MNSPSFEKVSFLFKKMERTLIEDLQKLIGQKVKVCGWVHTIRDQGGIKFLLVRERTGIIQVVVTAGQKDLGRIIHHLTNESVVEIIGLVKKEQQAPSGIEISPESILVLSLAQSPLPIQVVEKKEEEASLEKRMDWRWLDLHKTPKRLIFMVWTVMEKAFRDYWTKNGYLEIHSPKFMGAPSESGAELFEVKYFQRKAYLAQSPQFYKQMAMAAGFEKVFETGPVFRANPSFTSRHDTEFTMYDVEISFVNSHFDLMAEEEKTINAVLSEIKKEHGAEIKKEFGREMIIPSLPFPKVTMEEAKKMLADLKIKTVRNGDLSPEEEVVLCRLIKEKYHHEFVFVTDYPIEVRPFYHMRHENNPKITKSFDLLWEGMEITTGAQREHRLDTLKRQATEKGLRLESLKHYLDFFRFGCPPHGGFALGPSRMLMKIFNLGNVREVTYLYRGVNRLTP